MQQKRFTDEDIVRFLYDEMSPQQSDAFLNALCSDEELWDRYEHFQNIVEKLATAKVEPSEASISRIKKYVADTAPQSEGAVSKSWKSTRTFLLKKFPATISLNAVVVAVAIFFTTAVMMSNFLNNPTGNLSPELAHPDAIQHEVMFQWDDSALDAELESIRTQMQDLQEAAML